MANQEKSKANKNKEMKERHPRMSNSLNVSKAHDTDEFPVVPAPKHKGLTVSQCRWRVDPKSLPFKTTEQVKPLKSIVAQPRAVAALKMGAEIRGRGYNIFVTGLSATGRSTAVKTILEGMRLKGSPTKDRCYVNNFKNPDVPRLLTMPRGKGEKFSRDMARTLETLKKTVPPALEDETVLAQKRDLTEQYAKQEADLFKTLEAKVAKDGFALVQVQMGPYTRPDVFPVIDGNPVAPNQVGQLVEEKKFPKEKLEELYKKYQGYKADLRTVLKQVREMARELAEKTAEIEKVVLEELLKEYCEDTCEKFAYPGVEDYLKEVREYIIANADIFSPDESGQHQPIPGAMGMMPSFEGMGGPDPFRVFEVNVVRNAGTEDPTPVIVESHPTFLNVFGTVEREVKFGGYGTADFTMIRGGSLLRADGGYLVLNLIDVLSEAMVWRTLMRTLKTGKLQIQGVESLYSLASSSMKPEPIDIDVTVILIGDVEMYHMLSYYEEDFHRIFKIRADFDSLMPRGKTEINYYAGLASKKAKEDNQKHLTASAVARLVEEGARSGGRGKKLSARFGEIADLLMEANHFAKLEDAKYVDAKHIDKAIKEAEYRQDLVRDRIEEAMADGILMVDLKGSVVGQVNGLAVHDLGTFAFGRPQRITCEVSMGELGVVNIEREAKLSGRIYDKGMLILEGYLRHMYGMEGPITLSASIGFEQSYGMIDGDSATLAEVIVLTSELSGIPVRQDLAVTGSVNQKGHVQPIGGINEKIEGFFRICKQAGLTGTQGVVMPASNVSELMLNSEVLDAVKAGKFAIYPVDVVDDALEIFTGIAAGKHLKKGGWTKGSVHDRTDMTLAEFYWALRGTVDKEPAPEAEVPLKPAPSKRRREEGNGPRVPKDPRDQQKPTEKKRTKKR
jgi:lon-related putative ATP-dependent protease